MCPELGRRESRRGQAPGAAGRLPARLLCGRKRDQPAPHVHGAWCLRLPHPPQEARAPDSGWSCDTGSRSDQGAGGGRRAGWVGSGRDLRVVRAQGLLLAEAAGWSSLRLGFCPPTPVLWLQGRAVASGPCQGQACARRWPVGSSPGRWSHLEQAFRVRLRASSELGLGRWKPGQCRVWRAPHFSPLPVAHPG